MTAMSPPRNAILALTLFVLTNLACAKSVPLSEPAPTAIPGTSAPLNDSIDNVDFCFDGNEHLHLVWTVSEHGRQSIEARYQRLDMRTGTWAYPSVLGKCEPGPIRIVDASSGLNVIASRDLHHWVSPDSGQTWLSKGDLGGDSRRSITGFDATADKGELLVTYIASLRQAYQPRSESKVVIGTVRDSGLRSELTVFQGSHARPICPRLLLKGDSLLLVYAVSSNTGADTGTKSRILMLRSGDDGMTWSQPREVWPIGDAARFPFIEQLDATIVEGTIVVFYRAGVLFSLRSTGPTSWTSPVRVAVPPPSPSTRSYQAYSPSCASNGHGGRVAWIDTRFTRSEQTAVNPLGGIPWSDQPEWANNDVFSLPLRPYAEIADGSVPAAPPIRHTPDLSQASSVRTAIHGNSAYVIWAGRAKVGRSARDAGEVPQLFYVTISVE